MLLADLTTASRRVTTAGSRAGKVAALVDLLSSVDDEGLADVVWLLARSATVAGVDEPADGLEVSHVPAATAATLTVDEVAGAVARADEVGPEVAVDDPVVLELFGRATADEQAFLRSLRLGVGVQFDRRSILVSAIAAAADASVRAVRRAAVVLGSLSAAAQIAREDGGPGLDAVGLEPGRAILPTVGLEASDLDTVLATGVRIAVEDLPNGDRVQAHRFGGQVRVFDRALVDVTGDYAQVVSVVAALARADVVLDGVVVDDDRHPGAPRRVQFFDLLFDGVSLIEHPFEQRRASLSSLVPAAHRVPSNVTSDPGEIEELLREAIRNGRGGLVLKDLTAAYDSDRAMSPWHWLKPVFVLDLAVVGAEWGSGPHAEYLTSVLLAARSEDGDFQVVGRVSSGMSDEILEWQTERLRELELPSGTKGGAVEVRPELVMTVRCEGVMPDPDREGAVMLKSPRYVNYRSDISAGESATVAEVHEVAERPWVAARATTTGTRTAAPPTAPDLEAPMLPPPVLPAPSLAFSESDAAAVVADDVGTVEPVARRVSAGAMGGTAAAVREIEYDPYEEPDLHLSEWPGRVVLGTRVAALVWSAVLAVSAFAMREQGPDADGGLVAGVGRFGLVVAAALVVAGWWWSDQLARNIKLLDGRLPSRVRCVSAWLTPFVAVVLLEFTIVRLDPVETFDVRPLIIGVLFMSVVWRPYALIRRAFATLIRVRYDALLASAYLIDIAGFGLLWWRLSTWIQLDRPPTSSDVDGLVGSSAAATLSFVAGLVVWRMVVRKGAFAEGHRASSQRTRYEHRMLRLRGVDPNDPEVWWALVQRRADEEREAELAMIAAGATGDAPRRR